MNYKNFKILVSKSKIRMMIIGAVIALAGFAMAVSLVVTNETKVAYWIVTALFVLVGFPVFILSVRDYSWIKSGAWPLLKAINEKQKEYIVWIYNNEVISNVSGVDVGKSSNIILYNRHGKMIQIVLGKKASLSANTVINYLASEFPAAHLGFSDETRATMSKLFNKKM